MAVAAQGYIRINRSGVVHIIDQRETDSPGYPSTACGQTGHPENDRFASVPHQYKLCETCRKLGNPELDLAIRIVSERISDKIARVEKTEETLFDLEKCLHYLKGLRDV